MINNIDIKRYVCKRYLILKDMYNNKPVELKSNCAYCQNETCDSDLVFENCPFQCIESLDELFSTLMTYTLYYLYVDDGADKEDAKQTIDDMILYYFREVTGQVFNAYVLQSFCFYADTHEICEDCDGTGIIIDWDGVKQCESCTQGVKDYIPHDRKAMPLYGTPKFLVRSDLCVDGGIKAITPFIVIEKETNEIVVAGNYRFIHDYLKLPIFIDIEDYYPKYQVYRLSKFNKKYEIVEKEN